IGVALACGASDSQTVLPSVAGRVVTTSEAPIAGARVTLHLTNERWSRHFRDREMGAAVTDLEGRFTIALPERSVLIDELFSLLVTHDDFAPTAVNRITPWKLKTLNPTVTLHEGRAVSGTVTGKDGKPAVGADVEVYDYVMAFTPQSYFVTSARTDAN